MVTRVARVERQTESTHFTCPSLPEFFVFAQMAIAPRLETVGTKWMAGIWTKFSPETTLTMLQGPILASSLTSMRCFGKRFAELFEGEDQQLAWSGF